MERAKGAESRCLSYLKAKGVRLQDFSLKILLVLKEVEPRTADYIIADKRSPRSVQSTRLEGLSGNGLTEFIRKNHLPQ